MERPKEKPPTETCSAVKAQTWLRWTCLACPCPPVSPSRQKYAPSTPSMAAMKWWNASRRKLRLQSPMLRSLPAKNSTTLPIPCSYLCAPVPVLPCPAWWTQCSTLAWTTPQSHRSLKRAAIPVSHGTAIVALSRCTVMWCSAWSPRARPISILSRRSWTRWKKTRALSSTPNWL